MGFTLLLFSSLIIITTWATWCVINHRIRDGLIGKLMFITAALSGFAGLSHLMNGDFAMRPISTLLFALSLIAVRHYVLSSFPGFFEKLFKR